MPKSQKHAFQGLLYDRLLEIWVSSRQRVTSRVSILTSSRWGGGVMTVLRLKASLERLPLLQANGR